MKIAVALGAGGARGAFEMGVIKGLLPQIDEFVCAFGCSTGSLVATCIGANAFDLGERVYTKSKTGNIIKPLLWDDVPIVGDMLPSPDFPEEVMLAYAAIKGLNAMYNFEPLQDIIHNNINFEELKNSNTEVGYLTTNIETMDSVFFSSKKAGITWQTLEAALFASISVPLYMTPVKIPNKKGKFVDGGLTRHLPGVEILKARRYKEADVVLFISPIPVNKAPPKKRKDNLYGTIISTLDGLSDWNLYNSFHKDILEVKTKVEEDGKRFIVVQPQDVLPIENSLRFVPEETSVLFKMGVELASQISL